MVAPRPIAVSVQTPSTWRRRSAPVRSPGVTGRTAKNCRRKGGIKTPFIETVVGSRKGPFARAARGYLKSGQVSHTRRAQATGGPEGTRCASISGPAARTYCGGRCIFRRKSMSTAAPSKVTPPAQGAKITIRDGKLIVPDNPIVPFIEGDGTGPDIWRASVRVMDAAVQKAYGGKRKIHWMEVLAGEKANKQLNTWLPDETVSACREYLVSIKGPLTTPIGGGIRSLNVALRQMLDLYVCLRPVRWFRGVPSPVRSPDKVDMVIFRENTEDLYSGIEFEAGTEDNKKFMEILKYTEGAFRGWAYALAEREFGGQVYTWEQWERTKAAKGEKAANDEQDAAKKAGKVIVKDAIADITLQQVLTRPDEFDVIATMNLNGDYLSDALAAQVGGIGIAPGGNINYVTGHAVFEATHGTAPKYANQDKVNPGSVILSGEMMLRHLGWHEAADLVIKGMDGAITARTVTYDFARLMKGEGKDVKELKCSEFGD